MMMVDTAQLLPPSLSFSSVWEISISAGSKPERELAEPLERFRKVTQLVPVWEKIRSFGALPVNWDGQGGAAPDALTVSCAEEFINKTFSEVQAAGLPWVSPHLSVSEAGEIVFEWWRGGRKLTVYASGNELEFIKVSGPDIDDMVDGSLDASILPAWEWLIAA